MSGNVVSCTADMVIYINVLWSTSNVLSLVTPGETPKRVTGTVAGDWSKSAFRKPLVWGRFQLSDDPVTGRFFFHGTCDMWHVTEKSGCEQIALWDRICSANVRFTRKRSEWAAEMAIFPIQHYCTSLIIFVYTPFSDLPWLAEICYGVLSVAKDFLRCLSDASTPYIHVHPLKLFQ